MTRVGIGGAIVAAALAAGCATTDGAGGSMSADCDRACLKGFIDTYVSAMVERNPGPLPVAEDVRFTEDGVDMTLGQGIWENGVRLTDYRFDILDVREGEAASLVKLLENGSPVHFALRLKVEDHAITEIETMVVRNQAEGMIFRPDAITSLSPAMAYRPTPAERNTREEMIDAAVRYPEGLKAGSFVASDVPFAPDAYRFENGQLMAGPGCTIFEGCTNIKTQTIPTLSGIKYYVAAVDEEQGVVLIRMDFGPGSLFPSPDRPAGQTLSVFEAFKVWGDQVHAVEAFMEAKPGDAPLGWEPEES
jgi:hypothetical protein